MDTFGPTLFAKNDCLCDSPLQACKEREKQHKRGVEVVNTSKGQDWLSHVDEHVSLIALGMGVLIGFGGVVIVMITWDKAKGRVVPPKAQPLYGVYQFSA